MSDWGSDDEGPTTNGGFGGGGTSFGFGRGRGMGRGSFGASEDSGSSGGGGFGKSRGFGGGSGDNAGFGSKPGGFGSKFNNNNDENGDGGFGGGFGSNKSGGFGSKGRGGFGSGDEPRGGGFGEKKGLGRGHFRDADNLSSGFRKSRSSGSGCFKCGEEGHFSRECPKEGGGGGGRSGGRGCFKCGEEGHMSRECPNAESGGGRSGGRGCFKCGEEGHMSRDCPKADGGGGRSGGRGCFKCGEEGHMSRECPKADGGGGGRSGGRGCFKCGEEGHMSRDCPNAESGGGRSGGGGGSRGCYKCGDDGHLARDCPNADSSGGGGGGSRGKGCFKCGEEGHMSRECPNADNGDVGDTSKKTEIYVPPPPPETEEEMFKSIEAGINFDKYENIPVEVSGDDPPKQGISSFDEAAFTETIRGNITKAHYVKPTPIQKWAIPIILSGRDLMGCAQTGSGKTAAFLLPILNGIIRDNLLEAGSGFGGPQKPAAVIVGPTRELVSQIHQEARKFALRSIIRPVVVYGGTSVGWQSGELEKGAHVIAGTPGRLLDFISRGKISLENVKYLVLDEADRMLDMGFEPEIRKLVSQFNLPPKEERQTLMFSATFPEEIQRLAQEFLNKYLFVTVGRVGGANSDITQEVIKVSQFEKRDTLVKLLNESGTNRTLVFLERKRQADFLAAYLSQSQFPATSIHGDRLQREREEALRDFKTGRAPILIATSVAARGLDIPGVMHVINYDMPKDIDEYVHRIGRTGRCGNLGKATSFFDQENDKDIARHLVKTLAEAQQTVPDWLEEVAEGNFGSSFHGGAGKFGGRDTRRGKFGNDDGDSGFSNGVGYGGGSSSAAGGGGGGDDEDWD